MAHSSSAHANEVDGVDRFESRLSPHTHIHIEANGEEYLCRRDAQARKLTKAVATKVSSEAYAHILSIAHRNAVTASSVVRELIMPALAETAGNLAGIDCSREGRR